MTAFSSLITVQSLSTILARGLAIASGSIQRWYGCNNPNLAFRFLESLAEGPVIFLNKKIGRFLTDLDIIANNSPLDPRIFN